MKILIATRNPGKLREYEEMLAGLSVNGEPIDLVMLDDLGIETEVEETGDTFEENAVLKARAYAEQSGLLTLADDSGLAVDALGGAPGVLSARYAGEDATDADRYRKLLRELEGVPPEDRGARFVCAVALCTPEGEVYTAEGDVKGRIAFEPKGTQGFGYDPIFYIPGLRMTMAQADPEIKNRISHRAEALKAIRPVLERVLTGGGV
ncbi:MAG TPA: XTP/dITP diphosphatase [Aggregatilineales bacterium]|nr:XTP/dITP diphosphatase [Chloroflexota bacterium]HOA24084.1 XTP/dITP diphosphatase [Aggregatilineales bacterium]HPV05436.1 XTP/dITP diphosphatase [Aggregatilineales bacterium]HQA67020.1 XTP/dITP diphosphatase [Aggregatilineales bacterium]HQE17136.1 XTP/dITP diphosphatase [Aggregatilineales bacterium]